MTTQFHCMDDNSKVMLSSDRILSAINYFLSHSCHRILDSDTGEIHLDHTGYSSDYAKNCCAVAYVDYSVYVRIGEHTNSLLIYGSHNKDECIRMGKYINTVFSFPVCVYDAYTGEVYFHN